ncbi:MAG TPA: hypothetical protein VKT83_10085 [bacterium]|nr:hypothetical protein [bacterium]
MRRRHHVGQVASPDPARFTWLVVNRGGQWLIAHHHSSVRPATQP